MAGKPKRVLVDGYTENPGGVEALMLNVMKAVDPEKVRFDFLANCPEVAFEDRLLDYGARVYHITPRRESRSRFYQELDAVLSEHAGEYDAIWENRNSLANIDYLVHAQRFGIPERIIHCHNSKNSEGLVRGALHAGNRGRVRRVATRFWSVSDTASEWFYGPDFAELPGYRVVSNAIDVGHFAFNLDARDNERSRLGIPESAIVLGNVGRLHPQKNQALAIGILAEMVSAGENAYLLIVGQGELEDELRGMAADFGVGERVVFTGAVSDAASLYNVMDLFLFPSLYEGLGIVFLEAQANGLPCLVSDGVPGDGAINANIEVLPLKAPVGEWASRARVLAAGGRTGDIRLVDSRFDLPSLTGLFDWLGKES